jgi:cytochrome c oxidase subunit 2
MLMNQLNMLPSASIVMSYNLHYFMLVVCIFIFVAVFGVMGYSILRHRKLAGHKAANFHQSTTVELVWAVIPIIIVILTALPAVNAVVTMKDTIKSGASLLEPVAK